MSSGEKVAVLRTALPRLLRGDPDAWEVYVDPDIEWMTSPNLPDAGIYRGRDAVAAFLREQFDVVWGGTPRVDIERAFESGDDILLFLRLQGEGSHTRIPLDVQIAHVWTVRGGKVLRVQVFPDRQRALEMLGLRE